MSKTDTIFICVVSSMGIYIFTRAFYSGRKIFRELWKETHKNRIWSKKWCSVSAYPNFTKESNSYKLSRIILTEREIVLSANIFLLDMGKTSDIVKKIHLEQVESISLARNKLRAVLFNFSGVQLMYNENGESKGYFLRLGSYNEHFVGLVERAMGNHKKNDEFK